MAAYLADEPERRRQITRLAAERQAEKLAELAHAFGGGAATFGGAGVRQVALDLESAATAQDWTEVEVRLQALDVACRNLRAEIKRLRLSTG